MVEGVILVNRLCARDRQHGDGSLRLLRDFEYAVMERKQLALLTSGSLRIHSNAEFFLPKQLCSPVDGFDRFPGILPVNRQKAAAMDDPSKHRNLKILCLGDKGNGPLPQGIPCNDRVCIGAVITDKQDLLCILWQLFHAGDMNTDTKDLQRPKGGFFEKPAIKGAVAVISLHWIHKHAAGNQHENK